MKCWVGSSAQQIGAFQVFFFFNNNTYAEKLVFGNDFSNKRMFWIRAGHQKNLPLIWKTEGRRQPWACKGDLRHWLL